MSKKLKQSASNKTGADLKPKNVDAKRADFTPKKVDLNSLLLPKERKVTIEIIKDLALMKIGDKKVVNISTANQMVKLGNAKIIEK